MAQRRFHYERAFERYLRTNRIPYVAVDEAKKSLLPSGSVLRIDSGQGASRALKSFDFVVYGESCNLLVEVKGRRLPKAGPRGGRRLESWVSEDDVESLTVWRRLFGPGFDAAFVFVYRCEDQPPDGLFDEVIACEGGWYTTRAVGLDDYRERMRVRSPRWRTVDLGRADFDRLAHPFAPGTRGHGPVVPALEPLGARA
ncbi:MAG: HYExAFE family protein [Phycisphaerales bacterium JB040]